MPQDNQAFAAARAASSSAANSGAATTKKKTYLLDSGFDGIRFPILSVRVRGGMRNHEHVYPHSPGAAVEKLGRDLYQIEITPCFQANMIPDAYAGLWPGQLANLRNIFESGKTADLILPTIGKVRAMCTSWEQEFTPAKSISGESVQWKFIEDQESARLLDSTFKKSLGMKTALAKFEVEGLKLNPKPSLWDQISQAVDSVLSYKGQIELYSNLVESKLVSAISMLSETTNQVNALSDPRNALGLVALIELWNETLKFYKDQQSTGAVFHYKRTNRDMDIGQVSIWLYGDSTHTSDLLQVNAFTDPYAIPSGTNIRYYVEPQS
jgi:prophage DNA circulation protein